MCPKITLNIYGLQPQPGSSLLVGVKYLRLKKHLPLGDGFFYLFPNSEVLDFKSVLDARVGKVAAFLNLDLQIARKIINCPIAWHISCRNMHFMYQPMGHFVPLAGTEGCMKILIP